MLFQSDFFVRRPHLSGQLYESFKNIKRNLPDERKLRQGPKSKEDNTNAATYETTTNEVENIKGTITKSITNFEVFYEQSFFSYSNVLKEPSFDQEF